MNRRYRLERAALYAVVLNIVVRDMDAAVRFYRMLGLDISEFWYNSKRRHSGLQYRTPRQVHEEYLERQLAA